MANAFEGSKTGLSRLHEFGSEIAASDAYARLRDLLDYEENLSTLDVRVRRVGAEVRAARIPAEMVQLVPRVRQRDQSHRRHRRDL